MACCVRLAALLALCFPVGGFISPCLGAPISRFTPLDSMTGCASSSISNSSSRRSNRSRCSRSSSSSSSSSARVSPPRAIGSGGWNTEEVTAAREALINSESFEILVNRASDRLHLDEVGEAEGSGSSSSTAAAMGIRSAEMAMTTTTTTEQEDTTDISRTRAGEWKRNADKLKSLRLAVLESGRAREIASKLIVRLENNNRNRRSTSGPNERRSEELRATSPPPQQEVIQDAPRGPSFNNMAERQDLKSAAAATEGGGGLGEASPGPPGIRWFRRIATKVSRVGRQAKGKVARAYRGESGTTDDVICRDA